ncbi:MAG: isoprenyl transferase [Alphaproteobacteria bacterium]|jgi:di-trans,poly-cis-decaprenylcistransferase|nr:isoprenyl transferase [Acetobacter sp.]OLA65547.1 MAG: di-trans,poly-cis-decaprenylcistransferase [Acetobacter sp. 46_36]
MDTKNICRHIAIIMDGNGRWAKKRGMPRTFGHKKGAENVVKITRAMKESGVKYLTLYAFSTENWQRSKDEVDALMQLLNEYLDKELKEIMDNNVRIVFIGERYMLSDSIQAKMAFLEKESEKNTDLTLCIALSYGSRQEILSAVKKIAAKVKEGSMDISQITQDVFSEELYTKEIPDPDVLIRTSGEQRISNYLLWQSAYTELFFTNTLWPDFGKDELWDIINKFNQRERRYGKN